MTKQAAFHPCCAFGTPPFAGSAWETQHVSVTPCETLGNGAAALELDWSGGDYPLFFRAVSEQGPERDFVKAWCSQPGAGPRCCSTGRRGPTAGTEQSAGGRRTGRQDR